MRLLLNCSNIIKGGGVQVALSIINELSTIGDLTVGVILNPNLYKLLNEDEFQHQFFIISHSPSSVFHGKSMRKELDSINDKFSAHIVLTVFGPSYWKPKNTPHFCGFADGWCYNEDSIAYKTLPLFNRVKVLLMNRYKKYWLKYSSDYFYLETEIAKEKFCAKFAIQNDRVFVVSNTYNSYFKNYLANSSKAEKDMIFRFITVSAFYNNKNLGILNEVVDCLPKDLNVEFNLTLPNDIFERVFGGSSDKIKNLGPLHPAECPKAYEACDAMILPTLLETFSASYPEAMIMRKPILTSDLDFARSICDNAALYFNPMDPTDIALKVVQIVENEVLYKKLQCAGDKRVKAFPSANDRTMKLISICRDILR